MQSEAKAKALEQFTDYFVKNYPGPDTVIFNPSWHAPKIFAAAYSAITAALPDKQAVEVKALEWSRVNADGMIHIASALPGKYWAWELAGYGYWSWGSLTGREVPGGLDAAKAAAQHDYATRIRSALVDVPAVEPDPDACKNEHGEVIDLEEAVEDLLAAYRASPTSHQIIGYRGDLWTILAECLQARRTSLPLSREGEDSAVVLARALLRISELTPTSANARDARDLHLTVKAIAEVALAATRSGSATTAKGVSE